MNESTARPDLSAPVGDPHPLVWHRWSWSPRPSAAPFVVVSDRLPGSGPDGASIVGGSGMPDDPVAQALHASVRRLGGGWVGRPNAHAPTGLRIPLHPVALDAEDASGSAGQADSTIWPLYHDLVGRAQFDQRWRRGYRRTNAAYAAAVARAAGHGATVWVHDYQLQLVPRLLRQARPDLRIGFYLQAPFPGGDLFQRMPMWRDILAGLIAADHLGFQTARSAENFLRLTERISAPLPTVGVYPTSVDTTTVAELSIRTDGARAAARLRAEVGNPDTIVLSIAPADETQGIEQCLHAVEALFRDGRLRPTEAVIVLITTGDCRPDPMLRDRVAQRVARINGQYAAVGRPCVHHVAHTPTLAERVALYQAADLLVATPLRAAATPVALEFVVAARADAALVLSEFSGTAESLCDAYIVNPHDHEGTANMIFDVLTSSGTDRMRRMELMRPYPAAYDTYSWATHFLLALHSNIDHHSCAQEPASNAPRWPAQPARHSTYDDQWLLSDIPGELT